MGGGEAVIVAGVGCRRLCPAEEIASLVRRAQHAAQRSADALATADFKRDEPGIVAAAALLGLKLLLVDRDALAAADARCATRSAASLRHAGLGSVAEAAALAASGTNGRLILKRIATARATCALAESAP